MRGFALGTVALIAAYLAVKPGAANAATQGGNIIVSALQRLLSPNVAGIPQRKTSGGTAATPSSSSSSGSSTGLITV